MKYISHRANVLKSEPENENKPEYILKAMSLGFEVMIDVWYYNDKFWLGHEEPRYPTVIEFLKMDGLWVRAKTIETLQKLLEIRGVHCFYHTNSEVTLTSNNYIWTNPSEELHTYSIAVLDEGDSVPDVESCAGICADNIGAIKLQHINKEQSE